MLYVKNNEVHNLTIASVFLYKTLMELICLAFFLLLNDDLASYNIITSLKMKNEFVGG